MPPASVSGRIDPPETGAGRIVSVGLARIVARILTPSRGPSVEEHWYPAAIVSGGNVRVVVTTVVPDPPIFRGFGFTFTPIDSGGKQL